ncbi:MAG: helix-turn-helix transcriptional regulator [Pseudomonadota bacterium]
MEEPGDRLKNAREAAGYSSARSACDAFGWKYPTYVGHENGARGFKGEAENYARVFRVSLEWLLTGKGSMRPASETAEIVDLWSRIPAKDRGSAKRMLESLADFEVPKLDKPKKSGERD